METISRERSVDSKIASLMNELKFRSQMLRMREAKIQGICDEIGPVLYPGALNKKIVLFLDVNNINWDNVYECEGFDYDRDGEVIMSLFDDNGDQFIYRAKENVQYKILENE